MKIYCIVVFPPNKKPFSASLTSSLFQTDPYEKIIKDNKWQADKIKNMNGIFQLTPKVSNPLKDFFYCFIEGERIAILACDDRLTSLEQDMLDKLIIAAQSSDSLMSIIQNPNGSINETLEKKRAADKARFSELNQQLEETKNHMIVIMDKIIERGEKLENLQARTAELEKNAIQFKQGARKLNSYMCPGLFSIFSSIKNFVWPDTGYDYSYRPGNRK